jgi:hypothetical protein
MSNHDRILPIQPLSFLDQESTKEAGDEIVIPETMMHQWMDLFPSGTSMLAKLMNMETDTSRVVCIGSSDKAEFIYAPNWILQHLGYSSDGLEQLVYISPYTEEIPAAISISLRPMDTAIYHTDLLEVIQSYLDRFHVMEAGTTICLPLGELGGYEICTVIEQVEPPGIVRLGGEVHLEMLPPEGGIPEHEEVDEIPFEDDIVETPLPVITESSANSASAASVTTVATNTTIEDHRIKMQEAWARRFQNLNKKEDE